MGSDDQLGYDPSPTPKLSLFSFSGKLHESPAGMLTPPIHTLASVPFKWEEAPGKPRPSCISTHQSKPKFARCLELPPRLLNEVKVSNSPSPSTVLDGPYVSRSLSLGKGSSWSSLENLGGGKVSSKDSRVVFGSSRWGGFWKNNKEFDDPGPGDISGVSHGGETKVKITRIRRRSSFLGLSHSRSHFWTDIYESFKHAVPWTRR
ncbi:hypothetical protein OIU79_025238 [Salix purpurea]|uniref:Uncharacterized protein n=1 Tax=Salix purpurea TaxID=77065 RepID=A0A9Q0W4P7_SALPP|nr:hypothetical protein OIU79_025238 [Salix purpurea]